MLNNNFLSSINYDPTVHAVETFQFENSKDLNYLVINNENEKDKDNLKNNTFIGASDFNVNSIKTNEPEEFDYTKNLWKKIKNILTKIYSKII